MPRSRPMRWALVIALSVVLPAVGCSSGGSSGGGANPHGIVTAYWGEPQRPLEPANTGDTNGGAVLNMIFTGLVAYDPETGRADNAMAESITSPDLQHWTVKIKPGWKFSDGTPVTAGSYVDAWNYAALATNRQTNGSFFSNIEGYGDVAPRSGAPSAKTMSGLQVVNDTTFTVALTQKFSVWPQTLGFFAYNPLPKSFFSDHAAYLSKPVGNGPYMITSWNRGQSMQLRPYSGYSGANKPRNGGINLTVYTDPNAAYADLLAGHLDVDNGLPPSALANLNTDLKGRHLTRPAGVIQTLTFPLNQPQWSTPNAQLVRQGLSMAIDRPTITEVIFRGTRIPATDWTSPVLGTAGGYQAGLCGEACTYNPAKAKQLIQQAGGIPGGQLSIGYNADGPNKDWVDAVCNDINNALGDSHACVGKPVGTFAEFLDQIASGQMTGPFRSGWQMEYPLIQNFLQPQYTTTGGANLSHYSSPQFDGLVNQANAQANLPTAVNLFQQAERLLATDLPAIPLWYSDGVVGWSARTSNVMLNTLSVPVYTDLTVK